MSAARERWDSLPRAARWALGAGAFIALYFGIVEPVLDVTSSLSGRADVLRAGLERRGERAAGESEASTRAALFLAQFGEVKPPGRAERSGELNARIEEIFHDRAVTGLSIKARAPASFSRGAFTGVIAESEQVQRLVLDIDFESTPDVAAAVIADIERSPEVAGVGRLTLRRLEKDGRKLVQVALAPEAWVIAPKGGAR